MFALALSLVLLVGTGLILQGGFKGPRGLRILGLDPEGLGMGLVAILAAGYFLGLFAGVALIIFVIIHEFGHVAAYRVCGHSDARFRLVPLMGGYAISSSLPASHERQFFISLMGPAICLAPMVLCFSLVPLAFERAPELATFLWLLGQFMATLNFINLLPLWPLDGSRCLSVIFYSFWPAQVRPFIFITSALALAAGVYLQSMLLVMFTLFSAQSLVRAGNLIQIQRPMGKRRALLCLACYVATVATFFMGSGSYLWFLL